MVAGAGTGYWIYARTKARAAELEAEEAEAVANGSRPARAGSDYIDDPSARYAANALRRDDDVSLHTTYEDDLEGGRGGYLDDFMDDEDAHERDVFDDGDGDLDDEPRHGKR